MVFAFLLIFSGLGFIGYGLYEKISMDKKTEAALQEALEKTTSSSKDTENGVPDDWNPAIGEAIGILELPKIEAELPIVAGTDPNELAKGVGHYTGSSYPGEIGQIVMSGHNDTVFLRLGELEMGDTFQVKMPYGEYTYEIYDSKIVDENDLSIITLQKETEEFILTTCYPFHVLGPTPERYILYAKPVKK